MEALTKVSDVLRMKTVMELSGLENGYDKWNNVKRGSSKFDDAELEAVWKVIDKYLRRKGKALDEQFFDAMKILKISQIAGKVMISYTAFDNFRRKIGVLSNTQIDRIWKVIDEHYEE